LKDFVLKLDLMEKLAPEIEKAVFLIKQALEDFRVIIIRHHADCDGYCGALALQSVILPKITAINTKPWKKFKRLPMITPYYDYSDCLKDLSTLKETYDYTQKRPLLILVDNGCGEEDLLALKRLNQYPIDILIIDHHIFSNQTDNYCQVHLNARKYGDKGDITAGILCFEIANQMSEINPFFAALSAVADKSKDDIVNHYLKLAGKTRDELEKIAACVDFESDALRFAESDLIMDLFNDKQTETTEILWSEINSSFEKYKKVAKEYTEKIVLNNKILCKINLDTCTIRGGYPRAGKVVGITHRLFEGSRVTMGYAHGFVIFRVDGVDFKLKELFSLLEEKIPNGLISGGGHDCAGTVKFIPAVEDKVMEVFLDYVKSL